MKVEWKLSFTVSDRGNEPFFVGAGAAVVVIDSGRLPGTLCDVVSDAIWFQKCPDVAPALGTRFGNGGLIRLHGLHLGRRGGLPNHPAEHFGIFVVGDHAECWQPF